MLGEQSRCEHQVLRRYILSTAAIWNNMRAFFLLVIATCACSFTACQELSLNFSLTSVAGAGAGVCPATQDHVEQISQGIDSLIRSVLLPTLNPGYRACGCGGPGWRRAAYLNMSDPTQTCPPAWELLTTPRRSCARSSNAGGLTCYSAMFPIQSIQYHQVCGRIIGYQYGQPEAFVAGNVGDPQIIDGAYVDGISLSYSTPRQHVWSFAATLDERSGLRAAGSGLYRAQCECTDSTDVAMLDVPSYVGNDYFCETGVPPRQTYSNSIFYADDPLWDGQGCDPTSTCCTFNNPSWFFKQLPQSTNADLEVRLCSLQGARVENTPIELIEIYVK